MNAAFLASLSDAGPLVIHNDHVLVVMLPALPAHDAAHKQTLYSYLSPALVLPLKTVPLSLRRLPDFMCLPQPLKFFIPPGLSPSNLSLLELQRLLVGVVCCR